jgi:hypothetical protein
LCCCIVVLLYCCVVALWARCDLCCDWLVSIVARSADGAAERTTSQSTQSDVGSWRLAQSRCLFPISFAVFVGLLIAEYWPMANCVNLRLCIHLRFFLDPF